MKYSGAEWLDYYRSDISPLGRKVADILGQVFRGIYHIYEEVLHKRTDWANKACIEIVLGTDLGNWDNDELTQLVVLCASQEVQFSVAGAAPRYLRLMFRDRSMLISSVPTLDEHIKRIQPLVDAIAPQEAIA